MYDGSQSRHHVQIKMSFWRSALLFWRAKDFQSLMFPCFVFCLIVGVFPYTFPPKGSFTASTKGYAFCTIITLTYVGYLSVVVYQLDISQAIKFNSVPGTLQGNCYLIFGAFMSITVYLMHAQRMTFLQELQKVASRLPANSFKKMSWLIHLKDTFGFCFLFGQFSTIRWNNVYLSGFKVTCWYTTLIIFVIDMLYMNSVCILRESFQKVNKDLVNVKELVVKDEPHLLRRVYHKQRNPLLLMELRGIKKYHMMVSDAVQQLNETFSLQLVITTVLTFAEVTFSLYFYLLSRGGDTNVDFDKQIWYTYFVTSIAYYCTKIVLMVWACENARLQALAIGTSIHELISSTTDPDMKNELQLFALQVLQRNNTFSSKGLTMDATLLSTIIGNIITYLLILIQFLLSNARTTDDNDMQPNIVEHT